MHDVLMHEQEEPHDGFEPVPLLVYILFAAILFWGGLYIGENTADFRRDVFYSTQLTPPLGAPAPVKIPVPNPGTGVETKK